MECDKCSFGCVFQNRLDAINIDKAVEFVLSCQNFDGGFGCRPGSESHSGQVKKYHSVYGVYVTYPIDA